MLLPSLVAAGGGLAVVLLPVLHLGNLLLGTVVIVLSVLLLKSRGQSMLGPVVLALLVLGCGWLSYVLFDVIAVSEGFDIYRKSLRWSLPRALLVFSVFSTAVLVGATFTLVLPAKRSTARPSRGRSRSGARSVTALEVPILLAAALILLLTVYGTTPGLLWERTAYIPAWPHLQVLTIVDFVYTLGHAGLAYVMVLSREKRRSRMAFALWMAYLVVTFSFATRELSVMFGFLLFFLLLDRYGGLTDRRPTLTTIALCGLATVLCLVIPLKLREGGPGGTPSEGAHGLRPYTAELLGHPLDTVAVLPDAIGSVLVALPLTSHVAAATEDASEHDLIVQIAPPFSPPTSEWESILPEYRLLPYIPYNSLGTLVGYGWPLLVAYGLSSGLLLALLGRASSQQESQLIAVSFGVATSVLLGWLLLLYNLRSATNVLYLLLLLVATLDFRLKPVSGHPLQTEAK